MIRDRSSRAARISGICAVAFLLLFSSRNSLAQYKPTDSVPEEWKQGFSSITEAQSKEWLSVLAGPEFSGRGTGQDGFVKAAFFVAGKLAEYGFEPIGDEGTYFQNLPFARIGPNLEASTLVIGDQTWRASDGIGYVSFNANSLLEKPVVFVSGKGQNLALKDDVNLQDKIVVVNTENTGLSFLRPILQKQPAAIIQVVDKAPENRSRVIRGGDSVPGGNVRIQVTREMAKKIAAECHVDASLVEPRSEDGTDSAVTEVNMTIDLRLIEQPIKVPNVVGWLEGSDPNLKDEYIVIGAHLDHLGARDGNVYPGADDNASGSTAILQIAKALHENPVRPKRSVLYLAFAAEEIGLVGSKYYCDHPLKPLDKCVCMLNIDMIGRNEETPEEKATENESSIHLVGTKVQSDELHEAVLEANKYVGFDFEYDEDRVNGRSDQASFAAKGIPVTFLFGGFNPYYHQPSDKLDGINYSKIANAARLNYICIFLAAERGRFELNK